jgi:hypothetical protein
VLISIPAETGRPRELPRARYELLLHDTKGKMTIEGLKTKNTEQNSKKVKEEGGREGWIGWCSGSNLLIPERLGSCKLLRGICT